MFERRSRSDCVHEQEAKRIANVRFTNVRLSGTKEEVRMEKKKRGFFDGRYGKYLLPILTIGLYKVLKKEPILKADMATTILEEKGI